MPSKNKKLLFVISPIGEPASPTRKRADQIFTYVIDPIVSELGYDPVRADMISKPGIITSQIINHILDDPLVIADLTGHNPCVFYELAVRHIIKKPVILIIEEGERIPFDVLASRTIHINHKDLESADEAKKELKKQIEAVEKDPSLVDSPISLAVDLQTLKQSSNPEDKRTADLTNRLQEIYNVIKEISDQTHDTQRERGLFPQQGIQKIRFFTPEYGIVGSHTHEVGGLKHEHVFSDEKRANKHIACVPTLYAPGTTNILNTGAVGTKVDIKGDGATAFGLVEVFWDNLGTKIDDGYADSAGDYLIANVVIPEGVEGAHSVIVYDTLSSTIASTTFTITGEIKHIADP